MKKLMAIDGNNIINRAFYANPPMSNSKGVATNAVFGFLNTLFMLNDQENPDYIAVAFDKKDPTFRHNMYSEYKATRKGMPDELKQQMPILKDLLLRMNIPVLEISGFEADDILGTLAVKSLAGGIETIIVSGDSDLLQLADEHIEIRMPKTKAGKAEVERYKRQDVIDKYGVTPGEFISVKALMGDKSDNVPGVPGIGEITAYKIIKEYKTLENALENADAIKPAKAGINLREHFELALMSRDLCTIRTNIPVDETHEKGNFFTAEAYQLIRELGFKKFYKLYEKNMNSYNTGNENELNLFNRLDDHEEIKNDKMSIYTIRSADELSETIKNITGNNKTKKTNNENSQLSIFDEPLLSTRNETMTVSLDINEFGSEIYAAFTTGTSEPAIFACGSEAELFRFFAEFLNSDTQKVVSDSKNLFTQANKHDIAVNGVIFDTKLAGYLLNPSKSDYDVTTLLYEYFGELLESDKPAKAKDGSFNKNEIADYCGKRIDAINKLYPVLLDELKEHEQLELFHSIELPFARVLADMETEGIAVDSAVLYAFGERLSNEISSLTTEIYELAGEIFNINSPSQLSNILFTKLGLKGGKKTTQGFSTAAEYLDKLTDAHPIINKIQDHRTYSKLKSTYVDGLGNAIGADGKIHSTFNQTVTATGRISSSEPNLQNIPVRFELGRELRKVFVPSDGYEFLDGDYSQIELRILAHMASDETLIAAFNGGQDIHSLTASQVHGKPIKEVTALERRNAKAVNFGIIYGISAYSLAEDLKITVREADEYINAYFAQYPKVKGFITNAVAEAKKNGYAKTLFNRRRPLPELLSPNFNTRSFGERCAMNAPIQGTAADIIKLAMINIHRRLRDEGFNSKIILQVHDEILLEVCKAEKDKVHELVGHEMKNAVQLAVSLDVDLHFGGDWYSAK